MEGIRLKARIKNFRLRVASLKLDLNIKDKQKK